MGRKLDPQKLVAVEHAMASGVPISSVEREFAEKWKSSQRSVRRYTTAVRESWAKRVEMPIEERRGQLLAMASNLYRRCALREQHNTASRVLDLMARLWGVTKQDALAIINADPNGLMTGPRSVEERYAEWQAAQLKQLGAGKGDVEN